MSSGTLTCACHAERLMIIVAHLAACLPHCRPEPMFPGNCFTDYGNVSTSIFKYISHSSDMIAKAEQLLFPGQMPQSDVAFLFPRSSFAWDVPAGPCPHGNESPASQAMDYAAVLAGKPVLLAFSES